MPHKPSANDPLTAKVASSIESDDLPSLKELWALFWLRRYPFLICLLLTPLVAVALASLVPISYSATARLMIRHEGAGASFYKEIVESPLAISGQGAAEVIQSTPVVRSMLKRVEVSKEDLALPAYKVILGKLAEALLPLFGKDPSDGEEQQNDPLFYDRLAGDFKETLSAQTLLADRAGGRPRDDMVKVELESTNRLKVAAMANELCHSFIEQHNMQFSEAALAAHATLSAQAQKIQGDIAALRESLAQLHPKDLPGGAVSGGSDYGAVRDGAVAKPLVSGIASQLSQLELQVMRLRRIYKEDSKEVRRAEEELQSARLSLYKAEAMDSARALLSSVQRNQRHALMAAELYRTNQTGLTLVEEALPPEEAMSAEILHYLVPSAGGLALGGLLGLSLVIALNTLDPRVCTEEQVTALTGLPLLTSLSARELKKELPPPSQWQTRSTARSLCLLAQILRVPHRPKGSQSLDSTVILLGSCGAGESSPDLTRQLSALYSAAEHGTLCVVDGGLERAGLSKALGLSEAVGLNEWIAGKAELSEVIVSHPGQPYDLIPAGETAQWPTTSAQSSKMLSLITELRSRYKIVLWQVEDLPQGAAFPSLYAASDSFLLAVQAGRIPPEALRRLSLLLDPRHSSGGFVMLT